MNHINVIGVAAGPAKFSVIKTPTKDKPLLTFTLLDKGLPYQISEPTKFKVHFMKDAAAHIREYIWEGKEMVVDGYQKQNPATKELYIVAEYIQFTGSRGKSEN